MKRPSGYTAITTLSVALTITFYTIFTHYINLVVTGFPGLEFIAGVFASIGFYISFFHGLIWIYSKFLYDRINPREGVTGEWFYKARILGQEDTPIYGICHISRDWDDISAYAIHFNPKQGKFSSRFFSDYAFVDNHNLIIMYTSIGWVEMGENIYARKGAIYLTMEGDPPIRLYGAWTDLLPSEHEGDIFMQRRNEHTDKILADIGYPVNSSEIEKILNISPFSETIKQSNTEKINDKND